MVTNLEQNKETNLVDQVNIDLGKTNPDDVVLDETEKCFLEEENKNSQTQEGVEKEESSEEIESVEEIESAEEKLLKNKKSLLEEKEKLLDRKQELNERIEEIESAAEEWVIMMEETIELEELIHGRETTNGEIKELNEKIENVNSELNIEVWNEPQSEQLGKEERSSFLKDKEKHLNLKKTYLKQKEDLLNFLDIKDNAIWMKKAISKDIKVIEKKWDMKTEEDESKLIELRKHDTDLDTLLKNVDKAIDDINVENNNTNMLRDTAQKIEQINALIRDTDQKIGEINENLKKL